MTTCAIRLVETGILLSGRLVCNLRYCSNMSNIESFLSCTYTISPNLSNNGMPIVHQYYKLITCTITYHCGGAILCHLICAIFIKMVFNQNELMKMNK